MKCLSSLTYSDADVLYLSYVKDKYSIIFYGYAAPSIIVNEDPRKSDQTSANI